LFTTKGSINLKISFNTSDKSLEKDTVYFLDLKLTLNDKLECMKERGEENEYCTSRKAV
jgi:hypothetical protein